MYSSTFTRSTRACGHYWWWWASTLWNSTSGLKCSLIPNVWTPWAPTIPWIWTQQPNSQGADILYNGQPQRTGHYFRYNLLGFTFGSPQRGQFCMVTSLSTFITSVSISHTQLSQSSLFNSHLTVTRCCTGNVTLFWNNFWRTLAVFSEGWRNGEVALILLLSISSEVYSGFKSQSGSPALTYLVTCVLHDFSVWHQPITWQSSWQTDPFSHILSFLTYYNICGRE